MIHALAPWKELFRAAFFIAFVILGFRARRSERATITFIAYTIAVSLFIGFTQLEAWPFSNWALVHTLREPQMNRWDLVGIDESGRAWTIDPRVLQPIAIEEYDTWMRMKFFRMSDQGRQAVADDLIRRAEKGRQRFLATGFPGTDSWLLRSLAAPRHFHNGAVWRTANDVPRIPFRRFRLAVTRWDIETFARDPRALTRVVIYESR